MKRHFIIFAVAVFAAGHTLTIAGQIEEVKLDAAQAKITIVSAMRARKAPQTTAEEIVWVKAHRSRKKGDDEKAGEDHSIRWVGVLRRRQL